MGRHSKRRVKQRSKRHVARVRAGMKMRRRRKARGLHPASVRRRRRATRTKLKVK